MRSAFGNEKDCSFQQDLSGFFIEEIRSGFLVTPERKKLWAVQLDLLEQFDKFCQNLGLRYFASGGTLLGAVRHGGFIPWDDDIDVDMLWEDYKILLDEAPHYFKTPYFFQCHLTERESEPTFSMLRRGDTTGCTQFELECISDLNFNRGIFIDIFPLFNVPDDKTEQQEQLSEIMYWWRLYKGYEISRERKLTGVSPWPESFDLYEKDYLKTKPPMSFGDLKTKYLAACARVGTRTKQVAKLSCAANLPKFYFLRRWFDNVVRLPFEWLQVPCPRDYLEQLEWQFGNWREFVVDAGNHEMGFVDVDRSYAEVFKTFQDIETVRKGHNANRYIPVACRKDMESTEDKQSNS